MRGFYYAVVFVAICARVSSAENVQQEAKMVTQVTNLRGEHIVLVIGHQRCESGVEATT